MSIYHENHNKYPLYKNHYTLSGVAYIFKAYFIPYRDENRCLKSIFATRSDVNFSNFSFFLHKQRKKGSRNYPSPLKNQDPLKENQEPFKKIPKTF